MPAAQTPPGAPRQARQARQARGRRTAAVPSSSGPVRPTRPVAAVLLAVLALVLAAVAGCSTGGSSSKALAIGGGSDSGSGLRGTALGKPIAKPDVHLTDTSGRPYDLRAATAGRLTLLFFGYTNCPDVCPTTMADLAAALQQVGPAVRNRTTVVFVTSDPQRDTPEVLRRWLNSFDSTFVGLTGDLKSVYAAAAAAGVPLEPPRRQPDGGYTVQHGAQVLAFAPDGAARMVYLAGTPIADYAHDLPLLLGDKA